MTYDPLRIPATTYDAIALAAESVGGVGAGRFFTGKNRTIPCCIHGLMEFAEVPENIRITLYSKGLTYGRNDSTVMAGPRRMSWEKFVKAANLVRGK